MKKLNYFNETRIDKTKKIEESLYISGLLDTIEFLMIELKKFLKEENRFFGIAKSYMNSIEDTMKKINNKVNENDIEYFEKILFLYKPILSKEFNRLKNKKLSSGDSVICISRKILNILLESQEEFNKKEITTLNKIINKFFENIKNYAKNDPLYNLSNFIRTNLSNGWIGKYKSSEFSLDKKEEIKEEFKGSNIKLENNSNNKISEITWIGD